MHAASESAWNVIKQRSSHKNDLHKLWSHGPAVHHSSYICEFVYSPKCKNLKMSEQRLFIFHGFVNIPILWVCFSLTLVLFCAELNFSYFCSCYSCLFELLCCTVCYWAFSIKTKNLKDRYIIYTHDYIRMFAIMHLHLHVSLLLPCAASNKNSSYLKQVGYLL